MQPPPQLTVSQWAAKYAQLSVENSAEPGKFSAFAYQNGIMDSVHEAGVKTICVIKSARVGYTKCLDNIIAYYLSQDPSPILLVQPRVEDAEDYSKSEILPMLRDTPELEKLTGELKSRDSGQTITKRTFKNGSSISFVGANSPGGFRRISARIVLFDEVDGFPVAGAGIEGDQIALGIKRSESFWNRKIVMGSSPTIKGESRIEKAWEQSDQRHYYIKCPHCGFEQVLKWQNLQWDKEVDENGKTIKHHPETAHFICESGNGCRIDETDKSALIAGGRWIAEKPFNGHIGFHIWAAYSLFPNASWRFLVEEFLRVRKDPTQLKTFVNLVLGETWEEEGYQANSNALMTRAEVYNSDNIPAGVLLLTAGVDTQDDRLELQIIGYGRGEETWVVNYHVIFGDPAQKMVWEQLDKLLLAAYTTEDGRKLHVRACCIDSGGHFSAAVYSFCRTRHLRRVFATKGAAGTRPIWPLRFSKTKNNDKVFIVGVDTAKELVYSRLRIEKIGAGYVHFPAGDAFSDEYYAQLTAEKVVTRHKNGRPYRVWVATRPRNEALDTFVLSYAALKSLPILLDRVSVSKEETAEKTESVQKKDAEKAEGQQTDGAVKQIEGDIRFLHSQKTIDAQNARQRPISYSKFLG